VEGSTVFGVGNAGSTGTAIGIDSAGEVSHSLVNIIGNVASTSAATGMSGRFISHSRVSSISAGAAVNGISANTVTQCIVDTVNQGAATSSATGISAVTISGSRVSGMNGNASATTAGFAGYRLATDCQADNIVNSGSGTSAAFLPPTAGQTVRCVVEGSSASGVLCLSAGAVVRGCTVRLNGSGTGIDVRNTAGVIEDNSVSECATGVAVTGNNGLVVKNRITACNTNVNASATSQTGPLVSATGAIASTSPWANFTD
jgi:hypothetical protein